MKLAYIIAYVPDVAQAVQFWERAFGIGARMVHESGTYAELETGASDRAAARPVRVAVVRPSSGLRPARHLSTSAPARGWLA